LETTINLAPGEIRERMAVGFLDIMDFKRLSCLDSLHVPRVRGRSLPPRTDAAEPHDGRVLQIHPPGESGHADRCGLPEHLHGSELGVRGTGDTLRALRLAVGHVDNPSLVIQDFCDPQFPFPCGCRHSRHPL
jgi:hypothetical protein